MTRDRKFEEKDIVYEDNDIIVCRKPAGIAVQTRRIGQPDLESEIRNYRVSKGEDAYIAVIHRLDQPVEGLIVFAKNQTAAAKLSAQVASHQFAKYYYALVNLPACHALMGSQRLFDNDAYTDFTNDTSESVARDCSVTDATEGITVTDATERITLTNATEWITLTNYMVKDGKTNTSRIVDRGVQGAKRAVLDYRIVKQWDGIALLDIHLHTGRHHQIRLQMAHAGMPIVGDRKYGVKNDAGELNEEDAKNNGIDNSSLKIQSGLALCAYQLEFTHPSSGKKVSFCIKPEWAEDTVT